MLQDYQTGRPILPPDYKPKITMGDDETAIQLIKIAIAIVVSAAVIALLIRMNKKATYQLEKQDRIIQLLEEGR